MVDKSQPQDKTPTTADAPLNAIIELQAAGIGNMTGMGTA
jgi:hypothetical protein